MMKRTGQPALVLLALAMPMTAAAAPATTPAPSTPPAVAVLTFQCSLAEPDEAGRLMADVLSARLGVLGEVVIVERIDVEKILREQQMGLTGLVSQEQAAKAGKLLGARLLLTGRVTSVGKTMFVVCKAINTETGQVKGLFLNLPIATPFDQLLDRTGEELAKALPEWIEQLIPPRERVSDAARLKALMADKTPPSIAVMISEEHLAAPIIDPAVQTEFEKLLTEAGVQTTVVSKEAAAQLAAGGGDLARAARLLNDTRYLVLGEAFSEPGGRVQNMVIAVARAEVKIIDLKEQKILWSDRAEGRAPDLSEHLAAKTALQKAGRTLAMRLLPKLFEHLPSTKKGPETQPAEAD